MKINKTHGFTLIEVLVALIILAIAAFAIVKTSLSSIRSSQHIKQSIAAHLVAQNALAQLQTGLVTFETNTEKTAGNMVEMNSRWFWHAAITLINSDQKSQYVRVKITITSTPKGSPRSQCHRFYA